MTEKLEVDRGDLAARLLDLVRQPDGSRTEEDIARVAETLGGLGLNYGGAYDAMHAGLGLLAAGGPPQPPTDWFPPGAAESADFARQWSGFVRKGTA